MNTIKFKKRLFGFKRKEVIDYIVSTEADFEAEKVLLNNEIKNISDNNKALTAELEKTRSELQITKGIFIEAKKEAERQAFIAKTATENQKLTSEELGRTKEELHAVKVSVEQCEFIIEKLKDELENTILSLKDSNQKLTEATKKAEQDEKTHVAARQMLTDYLNVLHQENIELSQKNAQLKLAANEHASSQTQTGASADEILSSIKEGIEKIIAEQSESSTGNLKIL